MIPRLEDCQSPTSAQNDSSPFLVVQQTWDGEAILSNPRLTRDSEKLMFSQTFEVQIEE